MPFNNPNCGSCWLKHHKCSYRSMSAGRCSYCADHITAGLNDARISIGAADPFPETKLRQALIPIIAGHVLHTDAADPRTIVLDLPMIDGMEQKITSEYSGTFDITNHSLVKPFNEEFHRMFAAKLVAKDSACPHIDNACLAGAYLHVFCSAEFEEKGHSFRESLDEEDSQQSSIEPHLRFMILCRISELVETVLKAIRQIEDADSEVTYAAAVLLCHETNFFGNSLRYGTTYNHIHKDIRDTLGRWLVSVSHELRDHVREGCARHQRWNSVILGSLKNFKRLHHLKSLLKITLSLQNHRLSSLEPDEWPLDPNFASEGYPLLPGFLFPHSEINPEFPHGTLFSQSSIESTLPPYLSFSHQATNPAGNLLAAPNLSSGTTPKSSPDSLESTDLDEYIDINPPMFSQFVAGSDQSSSPADCMNPSLDHECSMERLFYANNCHDGNPPNVPGVFDLDPNILQPFEFLYFSSPSPYDALN